MNDLLHLWDEMATSLAVIVIVVTAMGLMLRLVELTEAFKRVGLVLGCLILLVILPPILVGIWHSLSIGQQLGTIILAVALGVIGSRAVRPKARTRTREH